LIAFLTGNGMLEEPSDELPEPSAGQAGTANVPT
jgi:hypothetical protein